jgi:hypothetical protein
MWLSVPTLDALLSTMRSAGISAPKACGEGQEILSATQPEIVKRVGRYAEYPV